MDELSVALKINPLELRLRCYSDRDQSSDRPYSSKALRKCYRRGAEAFGWHKRKPEPRAMREGGELVGWGMASGIWEALQTRSRCAFGSPPTRTPRSHAQPPTLAPAPTRSWRR
jgi:CO/xanthine dehydrogenase Mo-binding subunit